MTTDLFARRTPTIVKSCCAFAVLLFAAGCVPDLGTLPKPQEPAALDTARSFAAPVAEWPSDEWWKDYGDPQLNALVDGALAGSPDLKIAEARLKAAESAGDVAGANLWPTVFADGAARETESSQNQGFPKAFRSMMPQGWHHAGQLTAGFQYELDFFGKNWASLAAALSDVEVAKAESASARLQISVAVVQSYAQLMQLFADQRAVDDAVRIREDSARLVTGRWQAGLDNESSYSQAQVQLKAARVQAQEVARQVVLARHQIAALIGKGPDSGLAIVAIPAQKLRSVGLPQTLAADLIGRRPDVVAARHSVEAYASRIDVAEANFYPNIDLTGAFGVQTFDLKYLVHASSEMGAFGPAVHLPIFDYGRNIGIYRATRAEYDASVALYDKTLTNALHETADAYTNRRAVEGELTEARGALGDAENSYRLAKARYGSGLASYLDVLTVENAVIQQRRLSTDLEAQAFANDVALVRALGGGYRANP